MADAIPGATKENNVVLRPVKRPPTEDELRELVLTGVICELSDTADLL